MLSREDGRSVKLPDYHVESMGPKANIAAETKLQY